MALFALVRVDLVSLQLCSHHPTPGNTCSTFFAILPGLAKVHCFLHHPAAFREGHETLNINQ